jgi:DNA-binding MarR family transcriptional regulator
MPGLVPATGLAAWRNFLKAHAAAISLIETELERQGLVPLTWYDVLIAVSDSPGRRLRMRELARELVLTRSGATRLVDKLEAARLVKRERAGDDRRGANVVLTRGGSWALRRAWPIYAKGINELFVSVLTADEAAAVADGLGRVARNARARSSSSV